MGQVNCSFSFIQFDVASDDDKKSAVVDPKNYNFAFDLSDLLNVNRMESTFLQVPIFSIGQKTG
jgi:hypothetical protein